MGVLSFQDPLAGGFDLATYAWAFGQGVLVDLTPCVYPLIPITVAVFGAKGVSRGRALFLASAYVLGMALLYTSLGVAVALSGAAFGAWLGNPVVVLPIAVLLLVLSASMFGAFDLQLPTSMQSRLNKVGGAGPLGAFLMGLVSGLISAPCTGPVLLSLLAFIAQTTAAGASVAYGGSLLFVYALGMGTLFFAVALGVSLFRPGAWMEHVKSVFGIALIVMAVWFLRPISPGIASFGASWGWVVPAVLVIAGLALGAVHLSFHGTMSQRVRKAAGVVLACLGIASALNQLLAVPASDGTDGPHWTVVADSKQLEAALLEADASDHALVLDFAAEWCLPCKEFEKNTLHDPRVEARLADGFALIKIDVTEGTEDQERVKQAFGVGTLPGVVVYDSSADLSAHAAALTDGSAMPAARASFSTVVSPELFLEQIAGVR